jgi:hypothetical protein
VAGGWRRLHNEELRNLYASPNIISAIKARRMRWAVEMRNLKGKDYLEDPGVEGTIILERILQK